MYTTIDSINNVLTSYKNGNYNVIILKDGTKIRQTIDNEFQPDFPESMDVKITNRCDLNCNYCHENSVENGRHCNIEQLISVLKNFPVPGVELAIGGGNPLEHPYLIDFLQWAKSNGFICNLTINGKHINHILNKIIEKNLIHGLGISYTNETEKLIEYPHTVCHLIAGIHSIKNIQHALDIYGKVLILGYKNVGRGSTFGVKNNKEINNNILQLSNNLWKLFQHEGIISFDCLAIDQLHLKKYFTNHEWETFYMGDDGKFSMYFDAVNMIYGRSSTLQHREMEFCKDIHIFNFFKKISNIKRDIDEVINNVNK